LDGGSSFVWFSAKRQFLSFHVMNGLCWTDWKSNSRLSLAHPVFVHVIVVTIIVVVVDVIVGVGVGVISVIVVPALRRLERFAGREGAMIRLTYDRRTVKDYE
jgi:MFS superfamily sulfate permease-like transporter